MVLLGMVVPTDKAHVYLVGSRSEHGKNYVVNGTCECMDTNAPDGLCAHRLAARLYEKLLAITDRFSGAVQAVQLAEADLYLAQAVLAGRLAELREVVVEHQQYRLEDAEVETEAING
jgi:hypothetical protein